MNLSLLSHELLVLLLGLGVLMVDLWVSDQARRKLGYAAALGLVGIFLYSLFGVCVGPTETHVAFGGMYVLDPMALFFKRFFLVAAALVLVMAVEFSDRLRSGVSEFYSIILFALLGMMFAASANDFSVLFVSLELITVSFYVLNSYQRSRLLSLESGVKYLIIGALSTGFTVFGIALVFGSTGQLSFTGLARVADDLLYTPVGMVGLVMIMAGLGFKIAAVPFQIWAPDVYQGAPTPATAFLAIGSKAAGFVLLLRVLFTAVPAITEQAPNLLIWISGLTILYGNLAAIPQRNIKRLMGYSSIAHAGYLLLGVAAMSEAGISAVLFYLTGYLFTVLAAFIVIAVVMRQLDNEDVSGFAGLHHRSPLLATSMTLALVSLAGLPPLAGFFGKFLLLKSVFALGAENSGYYCLAFTALAGVVISLYYYFNVVRAIYWSKDPADLSPIDMSMPARVALYTCIAGMLYIGVFPSALLNAATRAVQVLVFRN